MTMNKDIEVQSYGVEDLSVNRYFGEPRPISYLIENLIPEDTVGAIYSQGGGGKSTICLLLAMCVALAKEHKTSWLNRFPINKGGKVLYISSEDPESIIHHRHFNIVKKLAEELSLSTDEVEKILSDNLYVLNLVGKSEPLVIFSEGQVKTTALYEKIKKTVGELCPILVIVDTKAKFSGLNENDNALISQEINKYEALVKDRGANLILLHHTTKNNGYYRGASSFLDSLRWGIQLSPVDSEIVKLCDIPNDEMDLYFVLENSKQNYSRKQKPVLIKRIDNYWFEAMNINWKSDNKAKLDRIIELIKNYMLSKGNTGFTQHALQKKLCKSTDQVSNHSLQSAIQDGLEKGVFVDEGTKNRLKLKVFQEPTNECLGSGKIAD